MSCSQLSVSLSLSLSLSLPRSPLESIMASVPKNKGKSKVAVAAPTAARFETIREQFRTASEHCDDSKQLQKTKAWVALLELTVQTLRTYLLTGSPTDADARQIHGFGKAVDEALRLWRLPADESQQPHAALPRHLLHRLHRAREGQVVDHVDLAQTGLDAGEAVAQRTPELLVDGRGLAGTRQRRMRLLRLVGREPPQPQRLVHRLAEAVDLA
ncbi:MAG: hypothetical protein EB068_01780, partial [Betaproteobacteria bacterium]|nr:hypothetical protein [Betaproteobacteria bacterium]